MLPRQLVDDYRSASFSHLQQANRIALESLETLSSLWLYTLRLQERALGTWLPAPAGGEDCLPAQLVDDASFVPASLARCCSDYVRLVDAQLRLSGDSTRSLLAELHRWTPRPADVAFATAGLAVDAIQLPAEALSGLVIEATRGGALPALPAPPVAGALPASIDERPHA